VPGLSLVGFLIFFGLEHLALRTRHTKNKKTGNGFSSIPASNVIFVVHFINLAFLRARHMVGKSKDKREVVREALRVVKKGGKFSFQDEFLIKRLFGEIDDLIETIKSWGTSKVEFVQTRDSDFIPRALKLPFILGTIGIISGEK
jgi:hypothetical protein